MSQTTLALDECQPCGCHSCAGAFAGMQLLGLVQDKRFEDDGELSDAQAS